MRQLQRFYFLGFFFSCVSAYSAGPNNNTCLTVVQNAVDVLSNVVIAVQNSNHQVSLVINNTVPAILQQVADIFHMSVPDILKQISSVSNLVETRTSTTYLVETALLVAFTSAAVASITVLSTVTTWRFVGNKITDWHSKRRLSNSSPLSDITSISN